MFYLNGTALKYDVVRGLFIVFDTIHSGFAVSEHYSFYKDKDGKEGRTFNAKIASLSNGIFNLGKFNHLDDIILVVGDLRNDEVVGSDLFTSMDIARDQASDGSGSETLFVATWTEVLDCLKCENSLKNMLSEIAKALLKNEYFLEDFKNLYSYYGIEVDGVEVLDSDESKPLTDEKLEILFKSFIKRTNELAIPMIDVELDEET